MKISGGVKICSQADIDQPLMCAKGKIYWSYDNGDVWKNGIRGFRLELKNQSGRAFGFFFKCQRQKSHSMDDNENGRKKNEEKRCLQGKHYKMSRVTPAFADNSKPSEPHVHVYSTRQDVNARRETWDAARRQSVAAPPQASAELTPNPPLPRSTPGNALATI